VGALLGSESTVATQGRGEQVLLCMLHPHPLETWSEDDAWAHDVQSLSVCTRRSTSQGLLDRGAMRDCCATGGAARTHSSRRANESRLERGVLLSASIHAATQGRRTDSEERGTGAKANIGTHKWSDGRWVMGDGGRRGDAAVDRSAADSVWGPLALLAAGGQQTLCCEGDAGYWSTAR